MTRSVHREARYDHPPEAVWLALTDPKALAEWLFPNNFEPTVGHRFRFQIDPMPVTGAWAMHECEVLEIVEGAKLVYSWTIMPGKESGQPLGPLTVTWTIEPDGDGAKLTLTQEGFGKGFKEWWAWFSAKMGWGRMLNTLLPKVLGNIKEGRFTPGAIPLKKRDYKVKTLPDDLVY